MEDVGNEQEQAFRALIEKQGGQPSAWEQLPTQADPVQETLPDLTPWREKANA